jgi:hypothetical protein
MDQVTKQLYITANNLRETVEDLLRATPSIPTNIVAHVAEVDEGYVLELAAAEGIPVDRNPDTYMDEASIAAFCELIREDQKDVRAFRELAAEQYPLKD